MHRRGFTLIELLVVISIIALLSSVVLASLNAAREKARIAAGKQFSSQAYRAAGDRAVGIWDFDEGTGSTAFDRSGFGNDGALSGAPVWSTQTFSGTGRSLQLNGSSDYVRVPYSDSLAPTSAVSFGAWFRANSVSSGQRIISKTESGGYQLSLNENGVCPSGTLCAAVYIGGAYHTATYPASSLSTDRWYHAIGTYDGETVKLYLDGRLVGSNGSPSGPVTYASQNPLCIGIEATPSACSGTLFAGYIDEVRVFEKALAASEAAAIYAEGAPRFRYAYEE